MPYLWGTCLAGYYAKTSGYGKMWYAFQRRLLLRTPSSKTRLMKRLFTWVLLVGSLLFVGAAYGQQETVPFPTDWAGGWQGDLVIYGPQGEAQRIPMQLRIHPLDDSTHTWTIVYGPEETGTRDYVLRTLDAATGQYLIDEQNSIGLEAYVLGGKLYSTFEVMGNYLVSAQELVGDTMTYEIISGSMEPVNISGNTRQGEEEIPEVKAYSVRVRQVAYLTRQK